ncbi:MAG: UvrD-helicase domain-containing protein [Spirochaetales bacterium]|nr:UvrD-helicase domain-containing protein [Spirochaetales bacterium]
MVNKKRDPDPYQKKAVDIEKNAVVSAGAGSGKTTVLANRYLRLVLEGKAGVANILTLTFTRKAAREMRARIYGLLLENSDIPRVQEQLALFDRSQISTLDSFCSQIARNWPQRFGMASDFKVDEEAAIDSARRTALEFMLEKSDDAALAELISVNGFDRVLEDFFVALSRSHITVAGELDFGSMLEKQKRLLAGELERRITELEKTVEEAANLDPGSRVSMQKAVEAAKGLLGVRPLAQARRFSELEDLLSSFKIVMPRTAADPDVTTMRELVNPLKTLTGELLDVLSTLKSEPLIDKLLGLSGEYQRRIISNRRSRGVLLYHDVALMARTCLLENTSLRRYYKNRFTFIMIDEFQDNNRLQKEILYLLAERRAAENPRVPRADELEPDKLFFVGDEKQSIYMFRGADVSVFKELSGEIEGQGGRTLSLPRNYRTEPGLISFFNTVFSSLMGDAQKPFEARFQPLEHRDADLPGNPTIRILYRGPADAGDDELVEESDAEAIAIARYIKDAVEHQRLDVKVDGTTRPVRYGDIALLMRSTSNQNRYERAFRILGIPHNVDSTRSLFLEAPVNDIYNLLQLAVYPEDRLAYAALLRSPFVNVSDEAFLALLLEEGPPFCREALDDSALDERDCAKLRQAVCLYELLRAKADRAPITELVSDIWYRHGYRYVLLKDPDLHPYLEYYDYLRELARAADGSSSSVADFLDTIRPHIGKYERLGDLTILKDDESAPAGVQILTVHRAKGLEFPVVILADTGNRGRTSGSAAPFYFADDIGLTFNITSGPEGGRRKGNFFYTRGKDEQQQKDTAETKRLLYVALTRAKHHLVISGRHHSRNRSADALPLNMLLASLGWEIGTEVTGCKALEPYLSIIADVPADFLRGRRAAKTSDAPSIEKALDAYRNALAPENLASPPEWTASGLESLAAKEWASVTELPALTCDTLLTDPELEAAFGTLFHSIIEEKLGDGAEAFHIPSALRLRLEENALQSVIQTASGLATQFLTSPAGRLLGGAVDIETEVPFLLRYEYGGSAAFISGVVDLLVDRGGETAVIDFKTDRYIREGEYHLQTAIYREAAAQLTGKPVRCFLVYVRNNTTVEIPGEPLPDLFALCNSAPSTSE